MITYHIPVINAKIVEKLVSHILQACIIFWLQVSPKQQR